MEHRPQAEMKGRPGQTIVDSIKKWSHDNLTLRGREDKLYLKKYSQIAEKLPKDISENQMALLELRLRQQAKSGAIGSIIIDGLVAGGALVGGAAVYGKLKDRAIHAPNIAGRARMEQRSKTVFQSVKDVTYNTVKFGADVASFGVKVVATPIEWGAKIMFWPIRKVGEGGAYVWGLVGGPEAAKGTATAVKEIGKIGVEAVKLPFTIVKDINAIGNKTEGALGKMAQRSADAKAKRMFDRAMRKWNDEWRYRDVPGRPPMPRITDFLKK